MGILFEKKSLTFKSPDVIHHWDTHTHTYIREQTKGLPEISIEVMSNAFIWKKLTKTKPQREPQKADWVLKSAQHSVIIWQFLREGDRGKWEGYNQHNSKLGLYQKKKKSDKIVSTWCSWENIHNSERQMLPWDRSRGEESEELPQPQHSGWQSSTWLGSAPRSGCTEQLCTSPSRWQQQYLSARSALCRDALFLPILCRDALFSYPTSSSLSSCAKPSTLWKLRFNRDSGRWLLYAGLILTDYSGCSREQTWQKSAGISGWCDNHN